MRWCKYGTFAHSGLPCKFDVTFLRILTNKFYLHANSFMNVFLPHQKRVTEQTGLGVNSFPRDVMIYFSVCVLMHRHSIFDESLLNMIFYLLIYFYLDIKQVLCLTF